MTSSAFGAEILDSIPNATPEQHERARANLAADIITGRVTKDAGRTIADALDLWDTSKVTTLPTPEQRAVRHTRRDRAIGGRQW